jgi:GNAT superfamily N-acetyltransferase
MVIRRATPADADAIATVHIASWRVGYADLLPADLLAALDHTQRAALWHEILANRAPRAATYVAELEGVVVGFASLRPSPERHHDPDKVGEVGAVYVDPAHWGSGAGRALLAVLESAAGEYGFEMLELRVLEGNTGARRFYERVGWATDGEPLPDRAGVSQHGFPDGVPVTVVRYSRALSAR